MNRGLKRPLPSGQPGRGPEKANWDHQHFAPSGPGSLTQIVENIVINNSQLTFPIFDYTTPLIAAGSSVFLDVVWTAIDGTNPVFLKWIKLLPSDLVPLYDFRILRTSDPGDLDYVDKWAFNAVNIQGNLERGFIWDYTDDDNTSQVHLWVANYGPGSTTLQVQFDTRDAT